MEICRTCNIVYDNSQIFECPVCYKNSELRKLRTEHQKLRESSEAQINLQRKRIIDQDNKLRRIASANPSDEELIKENAWLKKEAKATEKKLSEFRGILNRI